MNIEIVKKGRIDTGVRSLKGREFREFRSARIVALVALVSTLSIM